MIEKRQIETIVFEDRIEAVICDCCGQKIKNQKCSNQEYFRLVYDGGYFSDYPGDMTRIECEICEECLEKLVGAFARKTDLD